MSTKTKIVILLVVCVLVVAMMAMKKTPVVTLVFMGVAAGLWCVQYVFYGAKE